jgi:diacylglycerol kinase (ATP)
MSTRSPRRLLVLLNPRAGGGRGQVAQGRAAGVLRVEGVTLDVRHTESSDHARELAGTLPLEGLEGVGVVGGDGTLTGVVSGLMDRGAKSADELPPLAVIPAGTGNALAHELGLGDAAGAARIILDGNTRPLDLMRLRLPDRSLHAVTIVGWGLAADAGVRAERLRRLGASRYSLGLLIEALRGRSRVARIEIEGTDRKADVAEGRYTMLVAANTQFTGAGLKVAPKALVDDGLIDLIEVLPVTRRQALRLLQHVRQGRHLESPLLRYRKVRSLKLTQTPDAELKAERGHAEREGRPAAGAGMRLNVDGEIMNGLPESTPIEVRAVPSALRVFARPSR